MSRENEELVRSMYRPGDPSRFFDLLDDDVEVDVSRAGTLPDHVGLLRGKEAVVDYFRRYWGTWDQYVLEPTEVIDAGEGRVLVVHHERGRGKGSGAPFEQRWASLYTVRTAKIVRWETFENRDTALEAAGLEE